MSWISLSPTDVTRLRYPFYISHGVLRNIRGVRLFHYPIQISRVWVVEVSMDFSKLRSRGEQADILQQIRMNILSNQWEPPTLRFRHEILVTKVQY